MMVFAVGLRPTSSTSSFTFTLPRSTRPVTTVPRPSIENTSSIGIRNGLSRSRNRRRDVLVDRLDEIEDRLRIRIVRRFRVQRFEGRTTDDRRIIAVEFVLLQKLANLGLNEVDEFRIIHHIALIEEHHDLRHADLARQKNVSSFAASGRPSPRQRGSRRPSARRP